MPRNNAKPDPQRQLMIKVKACQRLVKEAAFYEKEVAENEATLRRMKDEGKDPYDVKKFQEVLGESHMMVPESASRRDRSLEELRELVASLRRDEGGDAELMGCEWMAAAGEMLGEDDDGGAGKEADDGVAVTAVEGLAEGEAF